MQNVHDVLKPMLLPRALDAYYERLASQRAPHRAGPDSARYASALRVAFRAK
jgi:DNA polymerase-3 subunit epsilon